MSAGWLHDKKGAGMGHPLEKICGACRRLCLASVIDKRELIHDGCSVAKVQVSLGERRREKVGDSPVIQEPPALPSYANPFSARPYKALAEPVIKIFGPRLIRPAVKGLVVA